MAFSLTSPVAGSAQTGLTSPTYTIVADIAPSSNGKQVAVTALGGTQTGVTVSSPSSPFTNTFTRPPVLKTLGAVNPITGLVSRVPRNSYKMVTRKGVLPAAGQVPVTMIVTTTIDVPAGADAYDVNSVRAALSLHLGALAQQSAGIGDTSISGIA